MPRPDSRRNQPKPCDRGFTLVEVMLAMLITSFVAVMAYQGLSAAITAAEGNQEQTQKLADIQLPLTVLERDIRHAVNRPIVDEYEDVEPALSGGELDQYLLQLTRRGWNNPRELDRGELQRVRYVLENDRLWRESWSVLDRQSEERGQQRTLLMDKVERFQLAFLDAGGPGADNSTLGGDWVDSWDKTETLPLAVEIKIDIEGFGEVRRVFGIPSQ